MPAKKASDILGVSANTLRRWDDLGSIKTVRGPGKQRLYHLASVLGKPSGPSTKQGVVYVRVSSPKQRDDLERQKAHMAAQFPGYTIISDVGSGLNFKRPGLLKLLGRAERGDVGQVVVASRDRLCRFAFELLEWLLRKWSVELVVLDSKESSPEDELSDDLMSIVQVFCCRKNGRRRYAPPVRDQKGEAEPDDGAETTAAEVQ